MLGLLVIQILTWNSKLIWPCRQLSNRIRVRVWNLSLSQLLMRRGQHLDWRRGRQVIKAPSFCQACKGMGQFGRGV